MWFLALEHCTSHELLYSRQRYYQYVIVLLLYVSLYVYVIATEEDCRIAGSRNVLVHKTVR